MSKKDAKKDKSLVLKIPTGEVSSEEDDMAYLTKRFQNIVRKHGHFIRDYPVFKAETKEYQRPGVEKEKKWDLVPEKNARKVAADYVVKKALVVWGDSSSESGESECLDDASMLAVQDDTNIFDGMFALMSKSDDEDDEEKDSMNNGLDILGEEKTVTTAHMSFIEEQLTVLEVENLELKNQLSIMIEKSGKRKGEDTSLQTELEASLNTTETRLALALERNDQMEKDLVLLREELNTSLNWTRSSELFSNITKQSNYNKKGLGLGNHSKTIENVYYVSGLKGSLLSISHICDKGNEVKFMSDKCIVTSLFTKKVILMARKRKNMYVADLKTGHEDDLTCLSAQNENDDLWHMKLGHVSSSLLNKLVSRDLVRGLPKLKFSEDKVCDACVKGKQIRSSFKPKKQVSSSRALELIHMYLCGPVKIQSRSRKKYILVIVDGYSRFTWTMFLKSKVETPEVLMTFFKMIQIKLNCMIAGIRSDHGTKFENSKLDSFCAENGIHHNFSAPRTPQQNGVVERKNRTLADIARTMIIESKIPQIFWAEAVNTACYVTNMCLIRSLLNKTPYELLNNKKPKLSYLRAFGCKCFVLNNGKDDLEKFDPRSDEGVFVGYSSSNKAYRVFNKRTLCIKETFHVIFDESGDLNNMETKDDDDLVELFKIQSNEANGPKTEGNQESNDVGPDQKETYPHEDDDSKDEEERTDQPQPLSSGWKHKLSHPLENLISPFNSGMQTRSKTRNLEELHQFERSNVWYLVPRPADRTIIGTRWVFRNKLDKNGVIMRNKSRLVVQGYNQEEGIDYDETFPPVAQIEAIRILIAFVAFMGFKLFQMDVKSAFLNGDLKEKVYVKQPPRFEDADHPNHVFKLNKDLYGLKQTPRSWYERLPKFLLKNGFKRGKIYNTLFLMKREQKLFIIQVYVDDIIFGATSEYLCEEIATLMGNEFEMSMMGELNFFLGADEADPLVNQTMYRGIIGSLWHLTTSRPDIVFSVGMCARFQACPRESYLKAPKRIMRYLKKIGDLVLFYPTCDSFELVGYADADFAGYQQQWEDFGVHIHTIPLKCDSTSAVNMGNNPVQHKRTNHIDVRHHFLRDNVEKGNISMQYYRTEDQIADNFTKAISKDQYESNMLKLGMMNMH
ncbi:hypothetical protein KY285_004885 [Solanum tuberosum]|nr:hypothetical protein KY285_004885 [Solanum tuberosum]